MTTNLKTATTAFLAAACVSVGAAVPFASAAQPEGLPNGPKKTITDTPSTMDTTTTPAEKKKGYGVLCKAQGLSKKHVEGQKGTPFSQCVVALAKVDKGETTSAKKACETLSKKHVKGTKGTPFSLCVKAASKQLEKTAPAV